MKIIREAVEEAAQLEDPQVEIEHLIVALAKSKDLKIPFLRLGISPEKAIAMAYRALEESHRETHGPASEAIFSDKACRALVFADRIGYALCSNHVFPQHLLVGLLHESDGYIIEPSLFRQVRNSESYDYHETCDQVRKLKRCH